MNEDPRTRNMKKDDIRNGIRAKRNGLDPAWIRQASSEIQRMAASLEEFRAAGLVSCYLASDTEVQTDEIVTKCHQAGKTVCVPRFNHETRNYQWSILTSETAVVPGPCGIRQPSTLTALAPNSTIHLILVPGLAFDADGRRIGYGGGTYDRLLSAPDVPVRFSVGLAFEFQVVDKVPCEPHDMTVDAVLTETRLIRIEKRLS